MRLDTTPGMSYGQKLVMKTMNPAKLLAPAAATVLLLGLWATPPAVAQSSEDLSSLRSEIEALKKGQEAIQKDLAEIRKLLAPRRAQRQPFKPVDVSLQGSPVRGRADAKVTLVEFTDYQCPYCRRHFTNTMPQLTEEYINAGKVKNVMRQFPLSCHQRASAA